MGGLGGGGLTQGSGKTGGETQYIGDDGLEVFVLSLVPHGEIHFRVRPVDPDEEEDGEEEDWCCF